MVVSPTNRLRVAIDIGGTFTDLMVFDPDRPDGLTTAKVLTTHGRLADGVRSALRESETQPAAVQSAVHGSTIVINALLERTGAQTVLVTTEGFRDVYEIARINRPQSFNLFFHKPRPLVTREYRLECRERINANGEVLTALTQSTLEELEKRIVELRADAVAVVFLHSYANSAHESQVKQHLSDHLPDLYVSASHEISREYREYERTSTTVANAYVGPAVSAYLSDLNDWLRRERFSGNFNIMQSNGGLMDPLTAVVEPIQMMESGPAGGVTATRFLCEQLEIPNAIAFDMGGTTAKACVIEQGQAHMATDYFVGGYAEGLPMRIPVLDLKEVGLGGGSIAWVESKRFLRVGPKSAGSVPGPAAYGRGGNEPTVSDADLILGLMADGQRIGREIRLDRGRAEWAVRTRLADPLEMTVEAAAEGILQVASAQMANGIRAVTLERGIDPSDFVLFAYGGAGPLHVCRIARELGLHSAVIPPWPGLFSAFGMLTADFRRDVSETHILPVQHSSMRQLESFYQRLESEATEYIRGLQVPEQSVALERLADMRYVGQEHSVTVPMPATFLNEEDVAAAKSAFDRLHESRYSHNAPDEPAEFVNLRVSAVGWLQKPKLSRLSLRRTEPLRPTRHRLLWIPGHSYVQTPVYERAELYAGDIVEGPAIVEEPSSVTVLLAGDVLTVGMYGELRIEVGS